MTAPRSIVVVGGGLAGAKAVEAARQSGFDGRVVLVADEAHLPYERPPLSKAVLRGEAEPSSAAVFDEAFYETNEVELRLGVAVRAVDVAGRAVELDGDERVAYDSLVLATGSAVRRLPGADGARYLRTVDDAVALRDRFASRGRVAVVGAGWIGCEVAASARQVGCEVTLVEPGPAPLHRVLGEEIGRAFGRLHARHGVDVRTGVGVRAVEGGRVLLDDGSAVEADTVVVGIGVVPRTELAEAAGLDVQDGIVVDERLRASAPGVFAAGDVASARHPLLGRHVRVEHWSAALNQGATAGRNAAGADEVYDRLPYFFSDQYDVGLEFVGHASPDDRLVVRGDVDGAFVACWLATDGRVTAAMHVDTWDSIDDLRPLVTDGVVLDGDRFADADAPLAELV